MAEAFDPYHKWLGIPSEDQPPDHYRLLGIKRFEPDPDVICNAADQRMAHVRAFQTGEHAELSQQILNELSTARVCLLNPERKPEYDRRLREKMQLKVEAPRPITARQVKEEESRAVRLTPPEKPPMPSTRLQQSSKTPTLSAILPLDYDEADGQPTEVMCPHCVQVFAYSPELAGHAMACPTCAGSFRMPRTSPPASAHTDVVTVPRRSDVNDATVRPSPPVRQSSQVLELPPSAAQPETPIEAVACPHCDQLIIQESDLAGQSAICPHCGAVFAMPPLAPSSTGSSESSGPPVTDRIQHQPPVKRLRQQESGTLLVVRAVAVLVALFLVAGLGLALLSLRAEHTPGADGADGQLPDRVGNPDPGLVAAVKSYIKKEISHGEDVTIKKVYPTFSDRYGVGPHTYMRVEYSWGEGNMDHVFVFSELRTGLKVVSHGPPEPGPHSTGAVIPYIEQHISHGARIRIKKVYPAFSVDGMFAGTYMRVDYYRGPNLMGHVFVFDSRGNVLGHTNPLLAPPGLEHFFDPNNVEDYIDADLRPSRPRGSKGVFD